MRLHGAVKRGECLPVNLLAERPVLGISFFEGVADRPFDCVQTVFPVGDSLQLLIVSRSGGINQRLAAPIGLLLWLVTPFRPTAYRKSESNAQRGVLNSPRNEAITRQLRCADLTEGGRFSSVGRAPHS